jgi:multidrug transporter EmrE-like cation transporter
VLFVASVAGQVISIGLLPRTNGFTKPMATVACIGAFAFGLWMIARMLRGGLNLGILVPLMSAVVPLASVAIAIMVYGEGASVPKVALLMGACVLIGIATRMA